MDLTQIYPQKGTSWQQVFPFITVKATGKTWMGTDQKLWFVSENDGTIVCVDRQKALNSAGDVPWRIWKLQDTAQIGSLWGDAQGKLYVSTQTGSIYTFDGKVWSSVDLGLKKELGVDPTLRSSQTLYSTLLYGSGANDIYLVALRDTQGVTRTLVKHFDGRNWNTMGEAQNTPYWECIWVSKEGHLFAGGVGGLYKFDGAHWIKLYAIAAPGSQNEFIFSMEGASETEIYAGGSAGGLFKYDGKEGKLLGRRESGQILLRVHVTKDGPVVCEMGSGILRFRNGQWETLAAAHFGQTTASQGGRVGVSDFQIDEQGRFWISSDTYGIGWLEGRQTTWLSWGLGNKMRGIAYTPAGDWYAVGEKGWILKGSVNTVEHIPVKPTVTWNGLTVRGSKDIYIFGDHATVMHFDGLQWKLVGKPGSAITLQGPPGLEKDNIRLQCLLVRSESDIYAGGFPSALLHFDGTAWKQVDTPLQPFTVPDRTAAQSHWVTPKFINLWEAGGNVYGSSDTGSVIRVPLKEEKKAEFTELPAPTGSIQRDAQGNLYARFDNQIARLQQGKWIMEAELKPSKAQTTISNAEAVLWRVTPDGDIVAYQKASIAKYHHRKWVELPFLSPLYPYSFGGSDVDFAVGAQGQLLTSVYEGGALFANPQFFAGTN